MLLSELEQILETQTLDRAKYYVTRLEKGIQSVKTSKKIATKQKKIFQDSKLISLRFPVVISKIGETGIKLKQILIDGERFYFSLSFDISEYIDGLWWLQIYDDYRHLIFDKPFATSNLDTNNNMIRRGIRNIIKQEVLYPKGLIL